MRQLSRIAPDSIWTIQAIGEVEESQGAYEEAIKQYRKILTLDPRRTGIHFRIGRVLLLREQQAEAEMEFEQELELDPTNANAAYELGVIHHRRAQYAQAQGFFERALKHYPDFQEAEVGLARTLIALEKPDLALSHLKRAVSLSPKDDVAYYHLSIVHRDLGNEAEQQKAAAEFQRFRSERSKIEEALMLQRSVTKQEP
jgi:tetratricopeptide (TPR) repeat protein